MKAAGGASASAAAATAACTSATPLPSSTSRRCDWLARLVEEPRGPRVGAARCPGRTLTAAPCLMALPAGAGLRIRILGTQKMSGKCPEQGG